eukprot:s2147_g12.t1
MGKSVDSCSISQSRTTPAVDTQHLRLMRLRFPRGDWSAMSITTVAADVKLDHAFNDDKILQSLLNVLQVPAKSIKIIRRGQEEDKGEVVRGLCCR